MLWKVLKRTSAIEMDIRMHDEGVPVTAESITAAAEPVAEERCVREKERFKRCIESIKDVNGHILYPEPDPDTGWARCQECGRVPNIKSDRFWSRVSCNTNRPSEVDGPKGSGHYSNVDGSRKKARTKMLAICDIDRSYQLTEWEKRRIQANKEAAIEKRKRKHGQEEEDKGTTAEHFDLRDDVEKRRRTRTAKNAKSTSRDTRTNRYARDA